jgi:hypothetical protein
MMVPAMGGKTASTERRGELPSRRLGAVGGVFGVAGVLGVASDVAKHVAWYVAHQIDGRPRERS